MIRTALNPIHIAHAARHLVVAAMLALTSRAHICKRRSRIVTTLPVLVTLAVAAIGVTIAAADQGGATIASAPTLTWGTPQDGIGGNNTGIYSSNIPMGAGGRTFWRVPTFAGDQITLTLKVASSNGCGANQAELFDPLTTDATAQTADGLRPSTATGSCLGLKFRAIWRDVPFTGLATLWLGISEEAPSFTFVATVRHRTLVRLAALPRTLATPTSTVFLRAQVSSAAGKPSGLCAVDRRADGGRWLQVQRVALRNSWCIARVTATAKHTISFRVRYLPDPTWLPSAVISRSILIG